MTPIVFGSEGADCLPAEVPSAQGGWTKEGATDPRVISSCDFRNHASGFSAIFARIPLFPKNPCSSALGRTALLIFGVPLLGTSLHIIKKILKNIKTNIIIKKFQVAVKAERVNILQSPDPTEFDGFVAIF
ncbi:MAG: hypothetical protein Q8R08_00365 [bacterium]|nr:hypothetical protein [bacterium]